ncbi:MAG: hypothetical protein ACHREM_16145 [Polyangiales bacterium]
MRTLAGVATAITTSEVAGWVALVACSFEVLGDALAGSPSAERLLGFDRVRFLLFGGGGLTVREAKLPRRRPRARGEQVSERESSCHSSIA